MSFELKDGQGSLFRNRDKAEDRQPDFTGRLKVEGIEFRLSGWTRETKDGRKYLSLSAMPKEARRPASQQRDTAPRYGDEMSDEISF